jgi:hypothetical protein
MASDAIYLIQFFIPVMLSLLLLFGLSLISVKHLFRFCLSLTPAIPISRWITHSLLLFEESQPHHKITLKELLERGGVTLQKILDWQWQFSWFSDTLFFVFRIVWIVFVLLSMVFLLFAIKKTIQGRTQRIKNSNRILVIFLFALNFIVAVVPNLTGGSVLIIWVVFIPVSMTLFMISRRNVLKNSPRRTKDMGFILAISFFMFSILVNIASALIIGGDQPRYFLPTMLIPLFFGWPFLIAQSEKLRAVIDRKYVTYGLMMITLLVSSWFGPLSNLKNIASLTQLSDYYPEFVKCVDHNTQKRNIRNGLAQYWHAKYVSMLSKNDLHVVQVRQVQLRLFLEHWINNLNWYNNDFEFVITFEFPGPGGSIYEHFLVGAFGKPADTFWCDEKKVLVYNREEDSKFQQLFRRVFFFEFDASALPSETGSAIGTGRVASEESDRPGWLTLGPSSDLPPGDYAFEIHYRANKNGHEKEVGKWEIVLYSSDNKETGADNNPKLLKKGPIEEDGKNIVSGVFKIRENGKTDIKTYYKGRGELRIDKITIKRMG